MNHSKKELKSPLVLGLGLLGLLACGGFMFPFLERLMIYYPLNDHHFETPKTPLEPEEIFWEAKDGVKTHGWFLKKSKLR